MNTLEELLIDVIEKLPSTENNSNKIEEVKAINIINAYCKAHGLTLVSMSNLAINAPYSQFRGNLNSRLTHLILKDTADEYDNLFKKQAYPLSDVEFQTELNKNMSTFDSIIGKSMIVIKTMSFGRKEVVTPLMEDAITLTKELNKIETIHSELPNTDNQIEYEEAVLIEE